MSAWVPGTYTGATGKFTTDPTVSGLTMNPPVTGSACATVGWASGHRVNVTRSIKINLVSTVVLP